MTKNIQIFIILLSITLLLSCRTNINEPTDDSITEETPFVVELKKIEYPSERVIWERGKSYEIKWEITKNLDKVDIYLLKKYRKVEEIAKLAENNGIFTWSIPNSLSGSHHYRIKLVSPYNLGASSTSVEFEITETPVQPPESE